MQERPLTGEPLALDLVNTLWEAAGQACDFFADRDALAHWLAEHHLETSAEQSDVQAALLETRTALRGVLERPRDDTARNALNAILERGRVVHLLTENGPMTRLEISPAARPAWRAAKNLLELLETSPQRVKRCANPTCVLYFYDSSPKNSRRWHSMSTCGNQVKARRHYDRAKKRATAPSED
jgi:predicted RNA-binding Zn ribbon-like protein